MNAVIRRFYGKRRERWLWVVTQSRCIESHFSVTCYWYDELEYLAEHVVTKCRKRMMMMRWDAKWGYLWWDAVSGGHPHWIYRVVGTPTHCYPPLTWLNDKLTVTVGVFTCFSSRWWFQSSSLLITALFLFFWGSCSSSSCCFWAVFQSLSPK